MSLGARPSASGAESKLYECTDCLSHHSSSDRLTACPDCGGRIESLSKPRAE